jgi:hypothetical protein
MYHQYLFIYLNKQKTKLSTLAYSKYEFSNVASNALYDQIYAAYVLYIYLYIFIIFFIFGNFIKAMYSASKQDLAYEYWHACHSLRIHAL